MADVICYRDQEQAMVRGDLGTLISQEALEPRVHSPHGSRDLEVDFFLGTKLAYTKWPSRSVWL